ncbi:unnamed protein product, partial [Anisakis simplex]|uniref:C-type lectin domain-containing protein n=1 Tax=Anisakis simplex TaxID=6269 RepID=A0A0M3K5P5_ANISI
KCPANWSRFRNQCYIARTGGFTHHHSEIICAALRGRLVWFNRRNRQSFLDEIRFVDGLALAAGAKLYWIGLNKVGQNWIWTNGKVATLTNWRGSEPDGCCSSNVTCATAGYRGARGLWDDTGCQRAWSTDHGFVCKRPTRP